jgi:prophage regulatory protein
MKPKSQELPVISVNRVIRLPEVKSITGLSTSTIYAMMSEGLFPPNISLGARAVGWIEKDIQDWINAKVIPDGNGEDNA